MSDHQNNGFDAEIRRCAVDIKLNGVVALGPLFDLTARRALRLAVSITGKPEDAEDVVQSVMLRVAHDPSRLATAVYPALYLIQMVRNESLTVLRKRKRTMCCSHLSESVASSRLSDSPPDSKAVVQSALDGLPPNQAEVVVLKVWERLTFAEIGQLLGVSANTAASRYRYALDKLTRSLACFSDEVTCP
ncbi:MAG: sigma-70 family RNA polymerase sigma factor [Planctomycetaceae bacterium]